MFSVFCLNFLLLVFLNYFVGWFFFPSHFKFVSILAKVPFSILYIFQVVKINLMWSQPYSIHVLCCTVVKCCVICNLDLSFSMLVVKPGPCSINDFTLEKVAQMCKYPS
uniref:Uncharacterized protein n=1 Tax=Cacopsylla melanoneura TaxID=428564 RepID=A0A8D8QC19_9HEMI